MSENLAKEHLDLLISASRLFNSTLELNEVLSRLLAKARELVGATYAHILLRENDKWVPEITIASEELDGSVPDYYCSQSIVGMAVEQRETLTLLHADRDDRFSNAMSIQLSGTRSVLCTPLIWQGEVQRVVYLDNRIKHGVFRDQHKSLIEALASQAAGALENAALYAEREEMYEKALEQAREELNQTQAQLLNASKLAAVGELAAGIAHEVNNPLCALALNIDAVSRKVKDPKIGKRLGLMEQAVERCRTIIEKLLNFTHPSRSERSAVRLDEVVEQTMELMAYQLKSVDTTVSLEPTTVMGEAANLSQVLLNLLSNSLFALSNEEEPRIAIHLEDRQLSLSDNGCGMSAEVKERIFEPFYTTKPVGQGTGLGLSVSFKIIRQHNAKIYVESDLNIGTTFVITFPDEDEQGES